MNMAEIIKRKEESRWEKHRDGAKKLLEQIKIALEESKFGMGVRLSHIEDVINCEILDEDFTVEKKFSLPYLATMTMVAELAGEEGMYSQRSEGQLYIWPNPREVYLSQQEIYGSLYYT